MNTTNTTVKTKTSAREDAVETNLTIEWEGMEPEDVRALAQQALIVKVQNEWRRKGIPAGDHTIQAADYKVGVRRPATKQTLEQMLAKLSAEERAALLEKYA